MAVINSPPTTPVDTQDGEGSLRPPSEGWRAFFSAAWTICNSLTESGPTAQRPTTLLWPGRRFFDITLGTGGEPIWRNRDNTGWVELSSGGSSLIIGTTPIIGTCLSGEFLWNNAGILDCAAIVQGHAIEDEGVALTQRGTINFVGAGVAATDAGGKTVVTIAGTSSIRLDQIATGTADSTLTTSGTITMTSGVGAANTAGKTIAIQPGAGGSTTAAGGALSLTGGTGTGNGVAGGAVTITGGSAGAGTGTTGGALNLVGGAGVAGGAINITSGASTSAAVSGNILIQPGTVGAANGSPGNVSILGAAANGIAAGSTVTVTAGTSGSSIAGGTLALNGGTGGSSNGDGGTATLKGGLGIGSGAGGAAAVQGGTAGSTGAGGAASVLGGTPIAGNGGAVNITGATGVGTNKAGGNVVVRPGAATGSGNPGNIQLDGGRGAALATTAIGGFVTIPTCAGAPTGVPVNVPTGSVAMIYDTTNNKLMVYNGAWKGVVLA